MKQLTVGEKFELIRSHGETLSRANMDIEATRKSDVIERAERIIELAKSITKENWAIE